MSRPTHQWDTSSVRHMKIEEEVVPLSSSSLQTILIHAQEAERLIQSLQYFDILDVGSSSWMEQHRLFEKLNLQAHQNALSNSDEYILEAFLTFQKIPLLFHDLLVIEAWKDHVYPLLIDDLAEKNSMRVYFILYHEATIVNLLEIFLFYKHFVEAAGETIIELVDYLARKMIRLNHNCVMYRERVSNSIGSGSSYTTTNNNNNTATTSDVQKLAQQLEQRSAKEELNDHYQDIEFRVCVTAVSLARFVVEHGDVLPLSVASRITDTHDYLLLLLPLIEQPPWTRRTKAGKWEKLIDHKWQEVKPIDLLKVTKLEGQPWLALYHLLAKEVFRERYYLHSFRKNQLLRVRKYIHDVLLDQLPFLADVQRYMDELAVTNVPEPSSLQDSVFMLQQVAMMREKLMKNRSWPDIAAKQVKEVFTMTDRTDRDLLAMANLYADDAVEAVLEPEYNISYEGK